MSTAQPSKFSIDRMLVDYDRRQSAPRADDDLVFVEFCPAGPVVGHGYPTELGPQHDAHANAWLDALDLHAPSGYRADLDAKIAALPAPAPLPSMPVAFALRRAAFGPVTA